jgi:hypothetical protein
MKKLVRNEKGQGIMEYVIISSLIGICCLAAVKSFGEVIQKRIENMRSQVANEINLRR